MRGKVGRDAGENQVKHLCHVCETYAREYSWEGNTYGSNREVHEVPAVVKDDGNDIERQ